jgi:hypothetical protein
MMRRKSPALLLIKSAGLFQAVSRKNLIFPIVVKKILKLTLPGNIKRLICSDCLPDRSWI